MIVIASHNKIDLLNNLLNQLQEIDTNDHQILVIDTNSKDVDYINQTGVLKEKYPNIIFIRKEYDCFDSGAYIHAYKNYNAERYIFLHDSITITNPNIILEWDKLLDVNDVVPMYNFDFFYDSDEQKNWAMDMINCESQPKFGIFGPIFAINRYALDLIPIEWLKEPECKMQACGMERRWSLIFHALNMKKQYMVHMYTNQIYDFLSGNTLKYAHFLQKHFYSSLR